MKLFALIGAFLRDCSGRVRKGAAGAGISAVVIACAVAFIGPREGLETKAYLDPGGVPTICYGETLGVKLGDEATVEECNAMFGPRVREYAEGVQRCIMVPMLDMTFVAFTSLAYNIGVGGFCRSSAAKLFNAGRWREACDAMLRFTRDRKGRELPGLVKRRKAERELCLAGAP